VRYLSLFSGIGGFDLGADRAGWECAGQCEIDETASSVLAKHWPDVRRWRDIRDVTAQEVGYVDCIAGGFPCQDISIAGAGVGLAGSRSGLWFEMFRLVCDIRPRYVIVENVSALLHRGLGTVLGNLASIGFDAEWDVLPLCAFGAPHSRERVFLIAYPNEIGCRLGRDRVANAARCDHWKATQGQRNWSDVEHWLRASFKDSDGPGSLASPAGMVDGLSEKLDQRRIAECGMFGNAISPVVAEFVCNRVNAIEKEIESTTVEVAPC